MTILQLTHWLSIDVTNSTLHTNDDLGWKALELSWLTIQGNRLWVDAFDWLALFLMMQFIYFSVKSNNERISIFPRVWSTLGVAIGCLALVDFIACCARFSTHWQEFSALAGVVSFINTVILLVSVEINKNSLTCLPVGLVNNDRLTCCPVGPTLES